MTGRAAAPSRRASTPCSRSYGITERSIASASGHAGRIGAGTIICASNCAASTLRVPFGRSTAAQILRVATSSAMVSSGRSTTPSSSTTKTSSTVLSIITSSPGAITVVGTNGGAGRAERQRRCRALPSSPRPSPRACTSRLNVAVDGSATAPGPYRSASSRSVYIRSRPSVPLERSCPASSTSRRAATTRSSARPSADRGRTVR
ncbi:hypothetical protein [Streptomyces sp. NPDC007088]|uniref:hypothetical protein n=1 Tax=Streptomyces sp. NPDC007088 TaxID=3364773 RepID=UPI0036C3D4FA